MFDLLRKKLSSFVEKLSGHGGESAAEKTAKKKPKSRTPKLSITKKASAVVTRKLLLEEKEVVPALEELELELLEADVGLESAEFIKDELKKRLVGKEVGVGKEGEVIEREIYSLLVEIMGKGKNIEEFITHRPSAFMFVGINGSGKTTTIAKVAYLLKERNYRVVLAAADTFRAAAIEQLEKHANALSLPIIKRPYGSDPTSVAYDALNFAKARSYDVVLIDTAGRQNTSIGLINEMKKMARVIGPQAKIFVGEGVAGSVITEQVKEFHEAISLDGVILTKLDCDPKGGAALSIPHTTGVPILYLGTGQNYDDLLLFDGEQIARRILGE